MRRVPRRPARVAALASVLVTVLFALLFAATGCPNNRSRVHERRDALVAPELTAPTVRYGEPTHDGGAPGADRGDAGGAEARLSSEAGAAPARRPVSPARVLAARSEAQSLRKALLSGGVAPREVAAIADIRGHRLLRRGQLELARVWFEAAVASDPSFEPALLNAARTAARLMDLRAARSHLARLGALRTPMAARMLREIPADPDFARLR